MTGFAQSMLPVTAVLITRDAEYPKDILFNERFEETIVETQCPNVLRRYERAAEARNEIIYFQDDDAVIDIRALWSHYNGQITHAITAGHKKIYEGTGVTLIGWGSFFPKEMVTRFLEREAELRQSFGDGTFETECDRVFTFLNRPHNTIVMPIREFRRPVRMSNRPDHYKRRDWVLGRLKEYA